MYMYILFEAIPAKNREFKTYENKKPYSRAATYSCLVQPNSDSYLKY
jgi:hypothetical protein